MTSTFNENTVKTQRYTTDTSSVRSGRLIFSHSAPKIAVLLFPDIYLTSIVVYLSLGWQLNHEEVSTSFHTPSRISRTFLLCRALQSRTSSKNPSILPLKQKHTKLHFNLTHLVRSLISLRTPSLGAVTAPEITPSISSFVHSDAVRALFRTSKSCLRLKSQALLSGFIISR